MFAHIMDELRQRDRARLRGVRLLNKFLEKKRKYGLKTNILDKSQGLNPDIGLQKINV